MAKRSKVAKDDRFQIDHYHRRVYLAPLRGLQRLVRIQRRNWQGVLLCDGLTKVVDTVTFSKANQRTAPFEMRYRVFAQGFLDEPKLSVANEAPNELVRQFQDEGKEFVLHFTPEPGKAYTVEQDIYRPIETGNGTVQADVGVDRRVGVCALTVDLSAYAAAGGAIRTPMCEFEMIESGKGSGGGESTKAGYLTPVQKSEWSWEWRLENVDGALIRVAWAIDNRGISRTPESVNLDRLATELKVDPQVAKDLYNFVSLCHYYVADYRSMNAIHRHMVAARSTLTRSVESIERLVGAELIERTKGKGLIKVTPAGEAVLEWWSRFYTRWTPIAPPEKSEAPRRGSAARR